jgi:hypothetical protein
LTRHRKADWFAVRYYRWALDDALRGAQEDFPGIRLVVGALAIKNYHYLSSLKDQEREAVIRAMVKRFHSRAIDLTGESLSPAEQLLLTRKDLSIRSMPDVARPEGVRAKYIRRHLRDASSRLGKQLEMSPAGERFELQTSGWTVRTIVVYSANPSYVQFVVDEVGNYLQDGISVLSWLGVAGQSTWDLAAEGEEAATAVSIVDAADVFLKAAPDLLSEPS